MSLIRASALVKRQSLREPAAFLAFSYARAADAPHLAWREELRRILLQESVRLIKSLNRSGALKGEGKMGGTSAMGAGCSKADKLDASATATNRC